MKLKQLSPLLVIFTTALILAACQPNPDTPAPPEMLEESSSGETMLTQSGETQELSVTTNYVSPAGPEDVGFTLIVDESGTIVDAQTEVLGKAPTSIMRQESFAEELPGVVVGKQLSELSNVDRVGGSSLTTAAFNEALESFKAPM